MRTWFAFDRIAECRLFAEDRAEDEIADQRVELGSATLELGGEHVANRDPLRHRGGVEEIEPGRHRLQQAKARRGRKLRIRQQRGKLFYVALIVEDRGAARTPQRRCLVSFFS